MSYHRNFCCCAGYDDTETACQDACDTLEVTFENPDDCSCNPFLSECCGPHAVTGVYFTLSGGSGMSGTRTLTFDSDSAGICTYSATISISTLTANRFTNSDCTGSLATLKSGTVKYTAEITKATKQIKVTADFQGGITDRWFESNGSLRTRNSNTAATDCNDQHANQINGTSRSCCVEGI